MDQHINIYLSHIVHVSYILYHKNIMALGVDIYTHHAYCHHQQYIYYWHILYLLGKIYHNQSYQL